MKKVQIINGPNLNMLGKREPEIYGYLTLDEINAKLVERSELLDLELFFFQSNHEGAIADKVHEDFNENFDGIIINPGALTHTSVVLRDALAMMSCPMVEIHLSNVYKREAFRHKSMLADIVTGRITGFGHYGYEMALNAIANMINES
ncbi:MAG: type II 3-dehydroquinate dehydratase [Desulfobacula sp.]|jgi:3-dehydroquinate dehydratase-2|uniref:type II 3-dehydroquinate dehydratase n=1 Tax=Desulfobacula sp. TaxID=2593537 RepID=UPI001DF103B3|nr:type II 3-dehydroquinate dehydratase [Desulfobacula sp.]MBT3485065.1 type II 3-dehydroquinate dehydratase [Desulfobacula sp.]MBT3804631.1 type II 3-dehydroquinate dehydratase [Desulfobacula sp.]MBT4025076.1 type II 3-dehydroquinate dehydratase [Desulfobacula sp.]MBT4198229.1 type II 3-dehydroquinate dehydratase [Desulfobacula sp.]